MGRVYHPNMKNAIASRPRLTNTVSFPRELRDAIPDHDPSVALAETILGAVEQAAKKAPVRAWPL